MKSALHITRLTRLLLAVVLLASATLVKAQSRRSNPFVSHMFTADPSAHVWEDGRLYVYSSTDQAPPKGYSKMDGYHVFSTDDMITWKDHGEILNSSQVEWGRDEGGFMWAPDCAFKNGTYYYYFPHPSGTNFKKTWKIGIATSTKPASDFKVQGYLEGIKSLIDPCVFVDDDGQAYFYQGGPEVAYGVKLKENMTEIDGEQQQIEGLEGFREGLFVFKRNDIYYAIYPDDFKGANKMRYVMSDSSLGPFKNNEVFVGSTDVITMHGSVVEFKDQWYVFYHNGNLSGGIATNRSICFDPIYFNDDGTIQMVKQTLGVQLPTFHADINFNGRFGTLSLGDFNQTDLKTHGIPSNAISSIEIPEGYKIECFEHDNFEGQSWIFQDNRINLNDIGCNDIITSIKVSKSNEENLVKNPSFELATQKQMKYWLSRSPESYSRYRDETAKDYFSLQYIGEGSPKEIKQKVKVKPHTNYQLAVLLKVEAGTKGKVIFKVKNQLNQVSNFELEARNKVGEWVTFTSDFNSEAFSEVQLICLTSDDFNGVAYWDNVVLKEK